MIYLTRIPNVSEYPGVQNILYTTATVPDHILLLQSFFFPRNDTSRSLMKVHLKSNIRYVRIQIWAKV